MSTVSTIRAKLFVTGYSVICLTIHTLCSVEPLIATRKDEPGYDATPYLNRIIRRFQSNVGRRSDEAWDEI